MKKLILLFAATAALGLAGCVNADGWYTFEYQVENQTDKDISIVRSDRLEQVIAPGEKKVILEESMIGPAVYGPFQDPYQDDDLVDIAYYYVPIQILVGSNSLPTNIYKRKYWTIDYLNHTFRYYLLISNEFLETIKNENTLSE